MSVLPIVTYEDDVLRKKAKPVQKNSKELQKLIDDMFDTMYNADGVGLSAPQVGKALRLFVADASPMQKKLDEESSSGPIVLINPKITFESEETITFEEGCLSIPDVRGPVTRSENVMVEFKDGDFKDQKREIEGVLARIMQHEIDHLDGILFVDHLSYFKQKLISNKLKELAEGEKQIDYPIVPK